MLPTDFLAAFALMVSRVPVLAMLAALCLHSASHAEDYGSFHSIESRPINEIWLNPGFLTYHFDTGQDLNNINLGLGAEYRYSTVNSVTAGRYHNSDRQITSYLAWYWQPVAIGPVRLGALAGLLNGYPRARNGDWFIMALPVASYEYGNFGFNLTVIPTIPDMVYGAISLQLKYKVN